MKIQVTVYTTAGRKLCTEPNEATEEEFSKVQNFIEDMIKEDMNGFLTLETIEGECIVPIQNVDYVVFKKEEE